MPSKPRHRSWLKHLPALVLAVAGVGLAASLAAGERNPLRAAPGTRTATEQARVIVRYKEGSSLLRTHAAQAGTRTSPRFAQALAQRHGLALRDGRMLGKRMQLVRGTGLGSAALAAVLAKDPDVEWAAVDGRRHALAAPNDPLYTTSPDLSAGQWYLRANGATVKSSIDVEAAWTNSTGSGVVVAVLDTGITAHEDLVNKIVQGYDFVGYAAADVLEANDGDLDDADPHDPGDWITAAEDDGSAAGGEFEGCGAEAGILTPSSWHGTQVSGIIGAETNNGIGMAGIALDTKILPVRVLGKCGGYDSDIIAGMYWAANLSTDNSLPNNANPAQVLNLSLGSQDSCTSSYEAAMSDLTAAGVIVVAAAGNDGLAVGTPANCPGVVAVAGLRHVGTKVGFSNLGPEITLGAPGGNCVNETGECLYPLLSTSNHGTQAPDPGTDTYTDGFNHLTLGTSFSSPIVAGTVALMLSANPALTPVQAISALKSSARAYPTSGGDTDSAACHAPDLSPQDTECYCTSATCGAGMADAGAAVVRALNGPFPVVGISTTAPIEGDTVQLTSSGTSALSGRGIASYQWAITKGGSVASFVGGTTGATALLKLTGQGDVEVRLTVTDSQGAIASLRQGLSATASSLAASITATPTEPEAGDSVMLSASGSVVDAGRTVSAYEWEIVSGSNLASLSGSKSAATATLLANAAGSVRVKLTITDSAGQQASAERSLTIAPAPSSGGGGGALAPLWGLGLALATLALRRRPRSSS